MEFGEEVLGPDEGPVWVTLPAGRAQPQSSMPPHPSAFTASLGRLLGLAGARAVAAPASILAQIAGSAAARARLLGGFALSLA
jgi:hypothetical protein